MGERGREEGRECVWMSSCWAGEGRGGESTGVGEGREGVREERRVRVPLRTCRPHIHPQHSLVCLFDVDLGCTHGQPQLFIVARMAQVVQLPAYF